MYTGTTTLEVGDVVTLSTSTELYKSLPYDEALGVVASRPATIFNSQNGDTPVTRFGTTVVKVTNENGQVMTGDELTISTSTPGYAMKLTTNGYSLGTAYTSAGDATSTTILITLNQRSTLYTLKGVEGLTILASTTEFVAATTTIAQSINNTLSLGGRVVVDFISVKMSAVVGYFDTIYAKVMHTDKLCVGETCVNEEQLKELLGNNKNNSPTTNQSQTPSQPQAPNFNGGQDVLGVSTSTEGMATPSETTTINTQGVIPPNAETTVTEVPSTETTGLIIEQSTISEPGVVTP